MDPVRVENWADKKAWKWVAMLGRLMVGAMVDSMVYLKAGLQADGRAPLLAERWADAKDLY